MLARGARNGLAPGTAKVHSDLVCLLHFLWHIASRYAVGHREDIVRMALYSIVVFSLLAGHLCCTSQADASTPRGVRFGQQGDLSRVVFELQEDVPYRLEAGSDPTLIRIIFPTLKFTPKLQVARARTGLIQEVRWSTNASQVMADIVLKQPGTVQHAARLHAPPRVVVDITRRSDGEVQKAREGAQGQGTVAAAPRVTDEHPREGAATSSPPPVAGPPAPTLSLPPVSTLTSTQLLERAEKQWAARQLEAAQRSYTTFLQRYPEHPNNHLIAARVADILRAQEHYRAALEAYVVVVQGYPGSEGAIISQIRMAELGTLLPDLLPAGDEARYAAYRHPLETLRRLTSDYPLNPLADVARFKLAEILLQQQDIAAALDLLQQLLRRPLQDALRRDVEQQLRQALGRQLDAYQRQGAFFDVLRTFFAYKPFLPPTEAGHADLLYPLVASYVRLGLLDEAQSLLPTLLNAAATPIQRAHIALAQATLFAQNGGDEVVTALLSPLQQFTDPTMRGQALLLLTESAWRTQRAADVVRYADLGEAILTGPVERTKFFTILGQAYEAQGEVNKAMQAFRKCAEVPDAGERAETCLSRAAVLHAVQGQHEAALALYERVLQTFPHNYKEGLLFRIAESYRQQFNKAQMLAAFTRLREHTQDAFWQRVATEYLEQAQWQERLQERLAVFQNTLMR
jgi:tetratricopeptide (TPR) repeat protein